MFGWIINMFKICYETSPCNTKKTKFIYFNEDENEYYSFDDNSTDIVKV
jgi:hypothetical protein